MNDFSVCVFVALLMLGLAVSASADRSFCDLKSGGLSANFNCGGEGITASYDGIRIIRNSSIWVHNPSWNYHYYGLNALKDDVVVKDIDGGKEALITHRADAFLGTQKVTVRDNQLVIEFKCKLLKDVKDADCEYCYGTICAAPLLGRPFNAFTETGKDVKGVVPIHATNSDGWSSLLTSDAFKKLEVDSRIGKISLNVTGNVGSLIMMDYRMNQYEAADQMPVFWTGTNFHMEYGKDYEVTVAMTIEPSAQKPAEAAAISCDAKVKETPRLRVSKYDQIYVIPEPQDMTLSDAHFPLNASTKIVVADSAKPADLRGAQSFADEINLLYGFSPKIVREREAGKGAMILVGEAASNKLLAAAAKKENIAAPAKDEGYALKVTPKLVMVLGHDQRGSYYGMQSLKQIVRADAKGVAIHGCTINDWPSLKYRGLHLFTSNEALPFHKKLIDRIMSRYKMNQLLLEVDFIKWKTDPTIAMPWSEDQSDVKKELDYAHDHFIEVNPLLQSLGHCDWLFMAGKHKELAENPDHPYAYCPSKPGIYDYIFKFYDETIKLFDNPKFVHIGHDEVQEPGGFPKDEECKKRSAEQIFVDDTLKVRDHIAKSGARVMMWGDMLLAKGDSPDATNAKDPQTAKWLRDQLPKDVAITDWHYAVAEPEKYKSLKIFMDEGHDAIASTWYTPLNIQQFAQQAKNDKALGLLQTTWAGFKSCEDNLKENFNQFSAIILAAEYAWNSGKTDVDNLPYNWDEEFRSQWNPQPMSPENREGFTLDISSACNVSLADNDRNTGWLGLGPKNDLSALPTGETRLRHDLYNISGGKASPKAIRLESTLDTDKAYPKSVEMGVDHKAKSLLFLHTCAWTDVAGSKIGAYKVNYSDGTSENIDLAYGVNIVSWIDQRSVGGADRVWMGRTKDDQRLDLWRIQWDNPHPEKTIKSIEFSSTGTSAGPVLVAVSGLD